jgi:hypothetical protein
MISNPDFGFGSTTLVTIQTLLCMLSAIREGLGRGKRVLEVNIDFKNP